MPACAEPGPESTKSRGEACGGPNDCRDPQVGCVALYGIARCLPFCDADAADADDGCDLASPAGGELRGRCVAVLPNRPDIGVCVYPCDPAAPYFDESTDDTDDDTIRVTHCPEAIATCSVALDLGHAVCSGNVGAGDVTRCGPSAPCPPRQLCAPYDDAGRCRVAAGGDEVCAEGEPLVPLPDSPEYRVCEPCRVVIREGGAYLSACHAQVDHATAAARCASEGGMLAPSLTAAQLDAIRGVVEGPLWLDGPEEGCAPVARAEGTPAPCETVAHAVCVLKSE